MQSLKELVQRLESELQQSSAALSDSERERQGLRDKMKQLQSQLNAEERTRIEHERGLQQHVS